MRVGLELAAVLDSVSFQSELVFASVEGGALLDVTTGVNWYVNHYVRVMFNYVAARPQGFGTEHFFQARLQVAL